MLLINVVQFSAHEAKQYFLQLLLFRLKDIIRFIGFPF